MAPLPASPHHPRPESPLRTTSFHGSRETEFSLSSSVFAAKPAPHRFALTSTGCGTAETSCNVGDVGDFVRVCDVCNGTAETSSRAKRVPRVTFPPACERQRLRYLATTVTVTLRLVRVAPSRATRAKWEAAGMHVGRHACGAAHMWGCTGGVLARLAGRTWLACCIQNRYMPYIRYLRNIRCISHLTEVLRTQSAELAAQCLGCRRRLRRPVQLPKRRVAQQVRRKAGGRDGRPGTATVTAVVTVTLQLRWSRRRTVTATGLAVALTSAVTSATSVTSVTSVNSVTSVAAHQSSPSAASCRAGFDASRTMN